MDGTVIKVVASTDKSLGLPLLPDIEENIEQLAIEIIRRRGGWEHLFINNKLIHKAPPVPTGFWRDVNNIIEGYKAASAKKYTEEDMRKLYEGTVQNVGTVVKRKDMPTWEQVLHSLNPLPIQVEVKITSRVYKGGIIEKEINNLLVDENNFVQVVKWRYE